MSFHSLGLSKPLLDALAAKNYSAATPIQLQAIPTVLTGRDLLGIAQTGTGKTAAFMLPSLDRLAANRNIPKPGQIRMLVLAPTRELASQIAASAEAYGKFMRLSVGVIFGGVPNSKSLRTVARGLDVLVATPGRLLDLIDQRALSLREGLDSTNNARRKADTLANGRLRRNHIVMVHHSAPDCITYDYRAASTWRSYCPFR